MKKIVLFLMAITLLITSCADSKRFKRADGTEFVAHPYGWIDRDSEKIPGVEYEICAGNIVWSVLTAETVVGPVLLTGLGLYEPVSYNDTSTIATTTTTTNKK
jgi:hypothetical protein